MVNAQNSPEMLGAQRPRDECLFDQSRLDQLLDGVEDPRLCAFLTGLYVKEVKDKYWAIAFELGLAVRPGRSEELVSAE